MNVNDYLTNLASKAIIGDEEKAGIMCSINTLDTRLKAYFSDNITKQFIFGSYERDTILPRAMDPNSDIDYAIVFSGASLKPQTYLNNLRAFAECYYITSPKSQSNPTIILTLNDIQFDLVPVIECSLYGFKIPAKASNYEDWIHTNPNDFNQKLASANKFNQYLIKPLIRLVKYWNARNNYPFESYVLEQKMLNPKFLPSYMYGLLHLKDYLYYFIEKLDLDSSPPQWKQDVLCRAKQIIIEATKQDHDGYSVAAKPTIAKLFL